MTKGQRTQPGPGRPRKFKLGMIAQHIHTGDLYVVVDQQKRNHKSEYRVIPTNGRYERFGRAIWLESNLINPIGARSVKGSLTVYRANEFLDNELGGRGCECQCCIHTAMPKREFNKFTGGWVEDE